LQNFVAISASSAHTTTQPLRKTLPLRIHAPEASSAAAACVAKHGRAPLPHIAPRITARCLQKYAKTYLMHQFGDHIHTR
jgi:hypothetical protein